jgi:hypothetical protein
MIGHLKLTPTGIIARTGFKYLRFDPTVSILPNRDLLIYKDKQYEYTSENIYVSFNDEDIKKETMSALVLSNCKMLNCSSVTGKCTRNVGERHVVLTEDFQLAPIVTRRYKGQTPDRNDMQVYSSDDFIRFNIKWDRNNTQKDIDTSLKSFDAQELWNRLKSEHVDLDKFLTKQSRVASNINSRDAYDRRILNSHHLSRFKNRYASEFNINYDVDLDNFKSMDVIDLTNIQEVKIDKPSNLSTYDIYEILPQTIIYRGTGFTKDVIEGLTDRRDKFYFMLVDDSIEHRIRKHTFSTLFINTKILVPETMIHDVDMRKELLFLKFNRSGLKKWLASVIISQLE